MRLNYFLVLLVIVGCDEGGDNRFVKKAKELGQNAPSTRGKKAKKAPKVVVDYMGLVAEGAILVDVRTPKEFAAASLPGAKNIPYEELLQRLDAFGSFEQTVIVFADSGKRSELATAILKQQGWKEVHNMGEMRNW